MGRPKKYATDEERRLARNARRALNPDMAREKERERKIRNKEHNKLVMKAYREANKERLAKQFKEYRENNKEKVLNLTREGRAKIADWYVAKVLKLNVSECSEELIEMKRHQMLVARQIRSLSKLLKETENG